MAGTGPSTASTGTSSRLPCRGAQLLAWFHDALIRMMCVVRGLRPSIVEILMQEGQDTETLKM